MEKSVQIIKALLIPILEKDIKYNSLVLNDSFWETFLTTFLKFEDDAKSTYELIYQLELKDVEKIFTKLPSIFSKLLNELAELYVLEENDKAIDFLLSQNNVEFQKQVSFFKALKNNIIISERKRIKNDLPNTYERLSFEIPEKQFEAAAKKLERENLKKKFKQWDEELVESPSLVAAASAIPVSEKTTTSKVISLTWIKYAVAACSVIVIGTWVYISNSEIKKTDGDFVTTPKEKTNTSDTVSNQNKIQLPNEELIKEKTQQVAATDTAVGVLSSQSQLGYTNSNNKKGYKINYIDYSKKISALREMIRRSDNPGTSQYSEEYNKLIGLNDKYIFDGITLSVYRKVINRQESILTTTDGSLYFYDKLDFYKIQKTDIPLELVKVKDPVVREELEKIIFENE
jgi:hypothetical protein